MRHKKEAKKYCTVLLFNFHFCMQLHQYWRAEFAFVVSYWISDWLFSTRDTYEKITLKRIDFSILMNDFKNDESLWCSPDSLKKIQKVAKITKFFSFFTHLLPLGRIQKTPLKHENFNSCFTCKEPLLEIWCAYRVALCKKFFFRFAVMESTC